MMNVTKFTVEADGRLSIEAEVGECIQHVLISLIATSTFNLFSLVSRCKCGCSAVTIVILDNEVNFKVIDPAADN